MNIEIIPVTAFQQNCSLIWDDEKNAAIIDPGGNAEKLIQRIEELVTLEGMEKAVEVVIKIANCKDL